MDNSKSLLHQIVIIQLRALLWKTTSPFHHHHKISYDIGWSLVQDKRWAWQWSYHLVTKTGDQMLEDRTRLTTVYIILKTLAVKSSNSVCSVPLNLRLWWQLIGNVYMTWLSCIQKVTTRLWRYFDTWSFSYHAIALAARGHRMSKCGNYQIFFPVMPITCISEQKSAYL